MERLGSSPLIPTLILASSGKFLRSAVAKDLFKMPLSHLRFLYVTTASKKVDDTDYVDRTRQAFRDLQITFTELDVVGKTKAELQTALSANNVVYVEGGNTFYLLKVIRETGFDRLIKTAITNGLIYWGASAGSYVACPTIEVAGWSNSFERCGITDLTAMNLVPFLIKAHYEPNQLEIIKNKSKDFSYPLYALADHQALVMTNGRTELVGGGEEIIL